MSSSTEFESGAAPRAPRLMLSAGGVDNPEILHDNGTVAVSVMDWVALCATATPVEAMTATSNVSVILIVCRCRLQAIAFKTCLHRQIT